MAIINFDNILQSHFKVYSFDVFDTVATRRTATPIGLFMIIQKVLLEKNDYLPKQLTENFTGIRIMAEQEARRITRNEEVTLDEIYGIVAQKFNLSHNIRDLLASLEIDQELQETRPVPQMVQLLNSLYEKNKRIIFTSDTYLPKDVIKKILVNFGVYKENAALYCSSELLITKASGKLFKKILLLEGCSPRDMVHIGDNFHVDILQARKIGIKTLYYSDTQLSRYENILLYGSLYGSSGHSSNYVWQIIAGASRLVRLNSYTKATRYRTLSNLGGSIACPIFLIYVIWLLQEAKKNNIQRLYFLSRDSQILLEIAEYVSGVLGLKIELRYLYASRQALSLPGLSEINENALSWMMSQDPYCSINIFARRVGLDPVVVQKELQIVAHRRINTNKDLNLQERAHLIGLIKGPLLSSLILNNAKKAKIAAADYFQQIGFFDKIRWGIVDLGWMGHLQSALREILNYAGYAATVIHGFYFGIIKGNIFVESDTNKKASFFFSEKSTHFIYSTGFQAINFFEIFTTAYHGSVMSYCYGEEDKPCPRFNNINYYNVKEWGLDHLRSGYQYFLKTIPTDFINDLRLNELFLEEYERRSCELMKCLMNDPSREEAEALGDYRFSGDQTETVMRRFAPPFSVIEALRFHFLDCYKSMDMTFWWRGTWARSNLINKIFLSSKFKIFAQKMCSMGVKFKNRVRRFSVFLNFKKSVKAIVSIFRFSIAMLMMKKPEELIIIVPFRNREENLKQFIPHMHHFLKDVKHRIVVIEQAGDSLFNRAKLLNVGFSLYQDANAYFCFHDIDLLPESALCDYSYPVMPTHLSPYCSQFEYQFNPYYFGGVLLVNKEDFRRVNGFSNQYWGWGGEDDDLRKRFDQTWTLPLTRRMGRYHSIERVAFGHPRAHEDVKRSGNPQYQKNCIRLRLGERLPYDPKTDGLSDLKFELLETIAGDGYVKHIIRL